MRWHLESLKFRLSAFGMYYTGSGVSWDEGLKANTVYGFCFRALVFKRFSASGLGYIDKLPCSRLQTPSHETLHPRAPLSSLAAADEKLLQRRLQASDLRLADNGNEEYMARVIYDQWCSSRVVWGLWFRVLKFPVPIGF